MKPLVLILSAMLLTSCATLERHPVATWVVAGIAAGTIAASDHSRRPAATDGQSICRNRPEGC
jgi:hypothetical protein